ncbi:MAG: alpha-glucan family phosphorylase [Deinococcales bacterium]
MNILGHITVLPRIPEPIRRLEDLAHNLYWTWEPEARKLFRQLDRELWEACNHNPITLLRDIRQERLDAAALDEEYLEAYAAVLERFDAYHSAPSWFQRNIGEDDDLYAYFCAEYGWHEAVALYSGGLGVLAGDHTKAASDLGVPLVAVGLFYPEGYFHQRVASDGRQEAVYVRHSPADLPLTLALDDDGEPVQARVDVFGREVNLRAWTVRAGRARVYLLDVDFAGNHPDDRQLLRRLYGGDQRTRVAQEIILGIGGVRLLRALGVAPSAWHMNEGHSAFMVLERCRELVADGLSFPQAREAVTSNTLFTVHTPVAAGNDAFPFDLVNQGFAGFWGSLGLKQHEFHELGKADHGWGPVFSMPALALRFSSGRNGVARLHGQTSRRIWSDLWPDVPVDEVPIGHVTNGVHLSSWMAPEMQELLGSVLPKDWPLRFDDLAMWDGVRELDDGGLWSVRQDLKAQSVRFLRRRVLRQLDRQEASPTALKDTGQLFDPNALTIGFARRFATYKRATLIFRDLDRLEQILADPQRPVQLVFSGKAHPADEPGQALIAHIHNLSKDPRFAGRVLFVEDYDMAIGRALTRGVDVWLNNPRRPLEASGTSGQKAAMNGILNLSILDGWWPEGFDGSNGWAIGGARSFDDDERADAEDADALYAILEREVVPLYNRRDSDGVPHEWLARVKEAIATVAPRFNAQRMVKDYVSGYYAPAARRGEALTADGYRGATELAAWRQHVAEQWPDVYFSADPVEDQLRRIGEELEVSAVLNPRDLSDDEIRVEIVYSTEDDALQRNIHVVPMQKVDGYPDGGTLYRARFRPELSGRLAYGVRAYAHHPSLATPFDSGAVRWA